MFRRTLGLALLATLAPLAHAAEFHSHVGATGRTCDFTSVQAAVDAASGAPDDTTYIHIARDQSYTAQQIDIDGKNVHLLGGYATCGQGTPDGIKTVLDGAGGARRSIINLRGSTRSVAFAHLSLRGGDELRDNESYGGALDITGGPHRFVRIADTEITGNSAGFGGAISLRWSDPQDQQGVYLVLGSNVAMSSNRGSYGGGGIYCRNGWIDLIGDSISVLQNTAGGSTEGGSAPSGGAYGGGMLLDQCVARIASWGFVPTIWMNTASGPGGGIAALNPRAFVDIGNRVPFSPTRIAANHSDRFGGAFTVEHGAQVIAHDAVIEDNSAAQGGGAVALYNDDVSERSIFTATSHFDEGPFRKACSSAVECNVIRGNEARDGTTARDGAAFRISSDAGPAVIELDGTRITANRGVNLVKRSEQIGQGYLRINGALFDRNETTENLFDLTGGYMRTTIVASTFADNSIGSNVFRVRGFDGNPPFWLTRSIVHQPGNPLISLSSGSMPPERVQYVLANDLTGIPTETGTGGQTLNLVGTPSFVDAAAGNYFLQPASPGVDFAAPEATDLTRDRGRRDLDVAAVPNRFGIQDLGAFERPNAAPFFLDADLPDGAVGTPYAYRVTVDSAGETVRFSADDLPQGLVIDPDSGVIAGTPTVAGTVNTTLHATNAAGTASLLRLVDIIGSGMIDGACGYAIVQTHTEAPTIDLCDAGTPTPVTGTGPWMWTCTGINGGTSQDCVADIEQEPPYIDTAILPDGIVGIPYDFVIAARSWFQPVTWQASGLPPGLDIDSATGRIHGVPTQSGLFEPVAISATNQIGTRTRLLELLVVDGNPDDALFADGFENAAQH